MCVCVVVVGGGGGAGVEGGALVLQRTWEHFPTAGGAKVLLSGTRGIVSGSCVSLPQTDCGLLGTQWCVLP